MSHISDSAIRVRVDPTNPGQFFACCGLLELADRLWKGAEGWFEAQGLQFCLRPMEAIHDRAGTTLISEIARCRITNTMTEYQVQRRGELSELPKKQREADSALTAEKDELDKLWREAPVLLEEPFNLRLDWFLDERAGGDVFKTWAGQQSVLDIARGIKSPIDAGDLSDSSPDEWLSKSTDKDCVPFNFDSDIGGAGSDRDMGFSVDPLKSTGLRIRTRPLIEIAAFVGLQRFRPKRLERENRYRFSLWTEPAVPEIAAPAACGFLASLGLRTFEFRLLYRTKYLKSFLPATPVVRS